MLGFFHLLWSRDFGLSGFSSLVPLLIGRWTVFLAFLFPLIFGFSGRPELRSSRFKTGQCLSPKACRFSGLPCNSVHGPLFSFSVSLFSLKATFLSMDHKVLFSRQRWYALIRLFGFTFLCLASALPSSYIATLQFVRQGSSAIKREIFS